MASTASHLAAFALILSLAATCSSAELSPNFYNESCPAALSAIKSIVDAAVAKEGRMGASLLRLHFHDCFVNTIDSEKNAIANLNSVQGFEVVDDIKTAVDSCCGGPVVSCADLLAVADRDSGGANKVTSGISRRSCSHHLQEDERYGLDSQMIE
ncbi:Cationic peroxidase 1 [Morus notabilis]|uniref:peroxidase n=1 Tax=Morus notabilis TaxID=981085 RepID=W9RNC5_9ROSA|nr:Cationic peroxidase 1 [Morus notabilis]